jgi:hypothetical protein
MSRFLVVIHSTVDRVRAAKALAAAPFGTRVEIKAAKRSLPQNDRMWAMLTDVAQQLQWHGVTLRPDDWKLIFLDGLKRELRVVPNLDGTGFVNLGRSSSDLTKHEMSDLIELIHAFGANHGVTFHDPESQSSQEHAPRSQAIPAALPSPTQAAGSYSREVA